MSKPKPRPLPPFLRPEALPAWWQLGAVLADLENTGLRTPCQADPETWVDDQPAVRRQAVAACSTCPATTACSTFAEANREPHGVWGGIDRAPRSKPKETTR